MKVVLLGINSKYVHTNLAIRYIREYLKKYSEIQAEIIETSINNELSDIIREVFEEKPDLLMISTYIWNKEYVFKIIRELKKIHPHMKICLGGPEVSYNSQEIMEEFSEIDYIISGEGEKSCLELLTMGIEEVKGVYYRKDGCIKYNGPQEPICNLDEIPFPYTEEEILENKNKILYYESSRGCPFNCSYCMSSIDKRVRYFSVERVKKDLELFLNKGIKLLKFVDRTYNLKKERYMKIWDYMLSRYNGSTTFHFEISGDLFDEETIEFLAAIPEGYFQFEIGVQTTNPKTLQIINRHTDLEKLKKNVLKIKDNIHLHLDLIAGLPMEGYETFKSSFDYVYSLRPEMIQLGFLKILKGTQISTEIDDNQYKYLSFPPYEVLSSGSISYSELLRLKNVEKVLDYYYNSGRFLKSIEYIFKNFYKNSFDIYEEIADFYEKNGYLKIAHKQLAIFNHLYDFYVEKQFENRDAFLEYLKYDYLMMGKPGFYPEWYRKDKNKEAYGELVKDLNFKTNREAYKKTEYEGFNYDVVLGKEGRRELLFIYTKYGVEVKESQV